MLYSYIFENILWKERPHLTVEEYRLHVELHKARVKRLGILAFINFYESFSDLSYDIVSEFLDLHDHSKVDDRYSKKNPISHQLSRTFGKNQSEPDVKQAIEMAVTELNRIDQKLAEEFFKKYDLINPAGELTQAAENLLRLENIADLVDRGFDQISHIEFGRKLAKASEFIVDLQDQKIAQFLEDIYPIEMTRVDRSMSSTILKQIFQRESDLRAAVNS